MATRLQPPSALQAAEPVRAPAKTVGGPLYRGQQLRGEKQREGAEAWVAWLRRTIDEQHIRQDFIANALGVEPHWVGECVVGSKLPGAHVIFRLPRSMKRALGLALLLSAENDNHGE